MIRRLGGIVCAFALLFGTVAGAAPRLDRIRQRGYLVCGVAPKLEGFSRLDARGVPVGFEPDLCRAVAAAILGDRTRVRFAAAASLRDFKADQAIDLIARRLTLTLRRDADHGVEFSPVVFHDGAALLTRRSAGLRAAGSLAGRPVCVARGSEAAAALGGRYRAVGSPSLERAFAALMAGRCAALAADLSELAALRAGLRDGAAAYTILPGLLSHEPLALLMHDDDRRFVRIVRWTIFALIRAEELGIRAADVGSKRVSRDQAVRTLLGVERGNGRSLGLPESWAANAIRAVGNYGELYERHLGMGSRLKLRRGRDALVEAGGVLEAPPME